jgi:hypothetical protein
LIIPPAAKFAVIRFLHAKNKTAAKIHRELCAVYGQRQWCRMFKGGRKIVHDEELSGLPVIRSDWRYCLL